MKRTTHKHPHAAPVPAASESDDVMPDTPFEEGAHGVLDPDLRHRMISEAAYYLYTQRGYDDGYDLDDWLQAEEQIEHAIVNPERAMATEEASAPVESE